MKAQACVRTTALLVLFAGLAACQAKKYETSQPYTEAKGYLITDSTIVRSADSLTVFPAFPSKFSKDPKLITKLEPYFPKELLDADVEGEVKTAGFIDSTGVVRKAMVVSSTEPRFNKHALFALIQWRFDPHKATNVWIRVPFRFRIMKSN